MFNLYRGKATVEWFPKIASVVIHVGDLLKSDGSGAFTVMGATDLSCVGISLREVAATDSDYASNTMIPVLVPVADAEVTFDVGAGSFTTAMVGLRYDLNSAGALNVGATAHKQVTVTGYISATKGIGKLNCLQGFVNAS